MAEILGIPELASVHGAAIDEIIIWIHWMMFVLFFGWLTYIFIALVKFRQGKNPKVDRKGPGHTFSNVHEVVIAIVEAVFLIAFSIPIYNKAVAAFPKPEASITVRVVGEQFAWNIHYPGADGKFGTTSPQLVDAASNPLGLDRKSDGGADDIVTLNQLHLPVNKPVVIRITSKDVIHSFKSVEMRITQDAIPGQEVPIWFEPNKIGYWNIACAQLCGVGHSQMRGFITVESQQDFDAWLAKQASEVEEAGEADDFW